MERPLSRDEFAGELSRLSEKYWSNHPFHRRLHAGLCSAEDVRRWVANRWYYQRLLPQKNAAIVARCPIAAVRRMWVDRIVYHDGPTDEEGGLREWLVLGEAVGLSQEEMRDERHVLAGTRFAVDRYLEFCLRSPWTESVAAALTELFSPGHMADRLAAWQRYYDWIKPEGLAYFERRIPAAEKDSASTLDVVLTHCVTRAEQDAAVRALSFKCDVLWTMLDAIDYAGRP